MAIQVKPPRKDFLNRIYFIELIKGLILTIRKILDWKDCTIRYPERKRKIYPRFRGRHALTVYENGRLRCVACFCCAKACPTKCIRIVAKEVNDPLERVPEVYEIDLLRCAFCGLCVEACPCGAIIMTNDYDYSRSHRKEFILNIESLRMKG